MTGLNLKKDQVIEIAVCVSDGSLKKVIKGPNIIVHCSTKLLDSMDEWCTTHHGDSGLTQSVKDSKVTLAQAEAEVLKFLKEKCGLTRFTCPIAGNSVGEDKNFIRKDMPKLYDFLHYRVVDVSTVKELAKRWMPNLKAPKKKECHRAMDDILESIEELKFYKQTIFTK